MLIEFHTTSDFRRDKEKFYNEEGKFYFLNVQKNVDITTEFVSIYKFLIDLSEEIAYTIEYTEIENFLFNICVNTTFDELSYTFYITVDDVTYFYNKYIVSESDYILNCIRPFDCIYNDELVKFNKNFELFKNLTPKKNFYAGYRSPNITDEELHLRRKLKYKEDCIKLYFSHIKEEFTEYIDFIKYKKTVENNIKLEEMIFNKYGVKVDYYVFSYLLMYLEYVLQNEKEINSKNYE